MANYVNVDEDDMFEEVDGDDRIEPSQIAPAEIVEDQEVEESEEPAEVEESSDIQDGESEIEEYSQEDRENDVQMDIVNMLKVSYIFFVNVYFTL